MFETFPDTPLFGANLITQQFKADPRPEKFDLGLGVYRNDIGATPVMSAVKKAEAQLLAEQTSKSYLGLVGDVAFSDALLRLVVGNGPEADDWTPIQTPGGVAALRLAVELIATAAPSARVWMSTPSWANHGPIMRSSGLEVVEFRYLDTNTQTLDFDGMLHDLGGAAPGDPVLLQACCHNPSGLDLSRSQWDELAQLIAKKGLMPILDVAYQGFGENIEDDVYGVHAVSKAVPEAFMAITCSKTFSTYRDRAGILAAMSRVPEQHPRIRQQMLRRINTLYAMPPDHAASVVRIILADTSLKNEWIAELATMRERVVHCRVRLADALRKSTNSDQFDFLTLHRGMFSILPLTKEQVTRLRVDFGVYILPSGRINLAGLADDQIDQVAKAIASVIAPSET